MVKIGIGIGIPFALIMLLVPAILICHKRRKRKLRDLKATQISSEDGQLYLQPKGELDAEESRQSELDGEQRIRELDGDGGIYEMAASDQERLELRGEKHARELGCQEEYAQAQASISSE